MTLAKGLTHHLKSCWFADKLPVETGRQEIRDRPPSASKLLRAGVSTGLDFRDIYFFTVLIDSQEWELPGLWDVVLQLLLLGISRSGVLQGVGVCPSASLPVLTKEMLPVLSSR